MVATIVGQERMTHLMIEKFHSICISYCNSRKAFKSAFEIDHRHVAVRAGQTINHLRWSLMNEEPLASLIKNALLNSASSQEQNPTELAVEGWFKDFPWVDPSQCTGKMEGVEPVLCARIIVRERKPKHLIVTVYVLPNEEQAKLPEVPYEIWN